MSLERLNQQVDEQSAAVCFVLFVNYLVCINNELDPICYFDPDATIGFDMDLSIDANTIHPTIALLS